MERPELLIRYGFIKKGSVNKYLKQHICYGAKFKKLEKLLGKGYQKVASDHFATYQKNNVQVSHTKNGSVTVKGLAPGLDKEVQSACKLLVKLGIVQGDDGGQFVPVSGGYIDEDADTEILERISGMISNDHLPSEFPPSSCRFQLVWEVPDMNLEEPYFWVLDTLRNSYPIVDKLEDAFAASENSSFFGVTQQRLGLQQDKITQYQRSVGQMTKELFQIVRELRILDERLVYYEGVEEELKKALADRDKAAEVTLKGFFIDLVQGGGKNPASVYGMASNLEFLSLPDLFFDVPPLHGKDQELADYIKDLEKDFNESVLRVLRRQLKQYYTWRESTHKEHINRRSFQVKYLKQHHDIIQMYVAWLKPYLRNAQRLSLKSKHQLAPDLLTHFEGSMLDVEILAHHPGRHGAVLVTFNFRTRPQMTSQREFQRGPVHTGRMDMQVRAYDWTKDEVNRYIKLKKREELELVGNISQVVHESMKALGDELYQYLQEATGESVQHSKVLEEKTPEYKLLKGGSDLKNADKTAFAIFHYFKKSHRMVAW